jgi:predicted polyphosphate/ATP-dependent NAD kinase
MTRRIGLIVNPIAGMGGPVGLKGTDDGTILARARQQDAVPRAGERTAAALRPLAGLQHRFELVTCPLAMGEAPCRAAGIAPTVLSLPRLCVTTRADTLHAAEALRRAGIELLLFAGGDGTARDVHAALGSALPILGIPSGVKMRSAVFAPTPARAGEIVTAWLASPPGAIPLRDAEIVDIDEADLWSDRPAPCLHGAALVPAPLNFVPAAKASPRIVDEVALDGLATELAATMEPGRVYLFGPGTTIRRILRALGIENGTLLGVDAVADGRLVGKDLGEAAILELLDRHPGTIVAGVIGGQGFLLGRGNQPLSARVIRRVGREQILVVAGLEKLTALDPLQLIADTGDPAVDAMLAGWIRVHTAPGRSTVVRLVT